jgi:Myb/SANT-like DNA-binding domain
MAPSRARKPSAKARESGLQIVQYSQPEESIEVDPFTDPPIDPQLQDSQSTTPSQSIAPSQSTAPSQLSTSIEDQSDRLEWTNEMVHTLFAELLDQALDGKRADSGFKKEAWDSVQREVQAVYPGPGTILLQKIKQKEQTFKGLYKDWRWLRDQSGFGWDEETQMITAPDQVWENVIKGGVLSLY